MNTYSIAGLSVNMECSGRSEIQAQKYLVGFTENPDITILSNPRYVKALHEKHPHLTEDECLYIYLCKNLSSALLDYDGFVLHSSAVCYENKAYLFSADSGTGKSTHTALWTKIFDGAEIINDDKPAIRIIDGKFYVCGTPFSGSSPLNKNVCVPLQAICFIERGQKNEIEHIYDNANIIYSILSQTLRKNGTDKTIKLMMLLDKLLKDIPIYRLKCLPNEDAAILAHKVMSK